MSLKAMNRYRNELTEIQEGYLDIIVNEYHGLVPYGARSKIAERLGCSRKYLYDLDTGRHPNWTAERDRRLQALIPFLDPTQMMAALQSLYFEKVRSRQAQGLDMTGKDPVDIIDQARRVMQGKTTVQINQQQNILDQSTTNINLANLSDEDLSTLTAGITDWIRNVNVQQLAKTGNIVDGTAEYTVISSEDIEQSSASAALPESIAAGTDEAQASEGSYSSEE